MIAAVIRRATADEAPAVADIFLAARRAIENLVPMAHTDDDIEAFAAAAREALLSLR